MSLKQEIETWVTALAAYDNNEFDSAIKCFEQIPDTSKILFNCGVIHATLGEHGRAVDCYRRAVQKDQYLAIAYFQQGVSNFLMGDFEEALANFNDTLLYLRGNDRIDYEQLGLKFKLYSCEVLFNRGLCYIYLQQIAPGMQDLEFAASEKMVPDHDVIDEAIREQAEGYTVFSIPVGVVYRPNEAKVKNLKTKDYLGKARLVAAQDQHKVDPQWLATMAANRFHDRTGEKLPYAALNLLEPELRSTRLRLQSEPPLQRHVFPPTPPPEPEQTPDSALGKRRSTESVNSDRSWRSSIQTSRPAAKPLRLELGAAAFEQKAAVPSRLRPGVKRSESERPAIRRQFSGGSNKSAEGRRREQERSGYHDMPEVPIEEDPIVAYSEQASQARIPSHQRTKSGGHLSHPVPIKEEREEEEEEEQQQQQQQSRYFGSSPSDVSPLAFEIVPPRPTHSRHRSRSRRAPEVRKVRIKVHADDMRYVMTTPNATFVELSEQIRQKFAFRGGYKLKIKDEEGDLVTMADQDDWEMAMGICKEAAAKDGADMGKMELWVQEM